MRKKHDIAYDIISPSEENVKKMEAEYLNVSSLHLKNQFVQGYNRKQIEQNLYIKLYNMTEKPDDITEKRFKNILKIKSNIFNIFLNDKLITDSILDDLERDCAINLRAINFSSDSLFAKKLCPHHLRNIDNYFYPVITPEIIKTNYPAEVLANPLRTQLLKHNINVPVHQKEVELFSKTDGWYNFFNIVPAKEARKIMSNGSVFLDPPDFPDSDSRHHGSYSHAIQAYIETKLFEKNYLGDVSVPGEDNITCREIIQADAWLLKITDKKNNNPYCLFDIMKEINLVTSQSLGLDKKKIGLTSPHTLNVYLMLNPMKYPALSSILYNQFALNSSLYFKEKDINFDTDIVKFKKLALKNKIAIMNYHTDHSEFPGIYCSPQRSLKIMSDQIEHFDKNSIYLPNIQTTNTREITLTNCSLIYFKDKDIEIITVEIDIKIILPYGCQSLEELLTEENKNFKQMQEKLLDDILKITSKKGFTLPPEKYLDSTEFDLKKSRIMLKKNKYILHKFAQTYDDIESLDKANRFCGSFQNS